MARRPKSWKAIWSKVRLVITGQTLSSAQQVEHESDVSARIRQRAANRWRRRRQKQVRFGRAQLVQPLMRTSDA